MINLKKAILEDCAMIHGMQVIAFKDLLHKYDDSNTNPGAESMERIVIRMKQDFTDYYLIQVEQQNIGAIRIIRRQDHSCTISPMFLLPEFQGKGYAQKVVLEAEKLYPQVHVWTLDTIKEEAKLCYLYEKLGYEKTGREEMLQDNMTIVYYEKRI